MSSLFGKILKNILIWIGLTNVIIISMIVKADNDFDRSLSSKGQESYGYVYPSNFYVSKKLSEFLGGPGKRSDFDQSFDPMPKRLSEFLGGPGKKRMVPSRFAVDKKLSEFLGGPGK